MSESSSEIYVSAPLRRLLAAEASELLPEIQRCSGDHGLLISAAGGDQAPALPMLACWTRLELNGAFYQGDLQGRADEPLPFLDDAFELVMLRHALEAAAFPQPLLEEAVRALSPGGLMVLSGIHPLSLWMPWMAWRARRKTIQLHMPLQLGEWLRRASMQVESVRRVGPLWPAARGNSIGSEALGGGFVLLARKRSRAVTPVQLVPRGLRAPVRAGLASSVRRNTA